MAQGALRGRSFTATEGNTPTQIQQARPSKVVTG
jgi:hypothetical protein